jgi:endonuclease-3
VTALLGDVYRSPRHDNKDDPLDELIFILLSQMTTQKSCSRVFGRLKEVCPTWNRALEMPLPRLRALIKDGGLSRGKAARIKEILTRVHRDFGAVSLNPLRSMDDAAAEAYLTSLPGVGIKTAKCVLMYSLGRAVLPVDTHVWRVAGRLGLVEPTTPYPRVHAALEAIVPPDCRYDFHVNVLAHGRRTCRAIRPLCESCPLGPACPYPGSAAALTGRA